MTSQQPTAPLLARTRHFNHLAKMLPDSTQAELYRLKGALLSQAIEINPEGFRINSLWQLENNGVLVLGIDCPDGSKIHIYANQLTPAARESLVRPFLRIFDIGTDMSPGGAVA